MEKRKVFVLVNPFSGNKQAAVVAKEFQGFLQQKRSSLDFEVFETEYSGHATALAGHAAKDGYTDLVVIGGDGTLNEAVNGLSKSKVPVSLLPAGTGNDFVKNFHFPTERVKQFELAINGEAVSVDTGICNNRRFVNTMGLGFDGQVVDTMEKYGKLVYGPLAYMYATLKELLSYKEPMATVSWEGHSEEFPIFLMAINNGQHFGGGFHITPDAQLNDGSLDVCLIQKVSVLGRFMHLPKALNGRHASLSFVKLFQTPEIKITSEAPIIGQIDGEYLGNPPFHVKVEPKALNVRCGELC